MRFVKILGCLKTVDYIKILYYLENHKNSWLRRGVETVSKNPMGLKPLELVNELSYF